MQYGGWWNEDKNFISRFPSILSSTKTSSPELWVVTEYNSSNGTETIIAWTLAIIFVWQTRIEVFWWVHNYQDNAAKSGRRCWCSLTSSIISENLGISLPECSPGTPKKLYQWRWVRLICSYQNVRKCDILATVFSLVYEFVLLCNAVFLRLEPSRL